MSSVDCLDEIRGREVREALEGWKRQGPRASEQAVCERTVDGSSESKRPKRFACLLSRHRTKSK